MHHAAQDPCLAPGGHIPQHDAPHPGRSAPPASTPLRGDTISSDAGARPRIRPTAEPPTRGATTTDDGPRAFVAVPYAPCPAAQDRRRPSRLCPKNFRGAPKLFAKFANHVHSAHSRNRGRNEFAAPAPGQTKRWPIREAQIPVVEAGARPNKRRTSKLDKFKSPACTPIART